MSILFILFAACATAQRITGSVSGLPTQTPIPDVEIYSVPHLTRDSWECATKNITALLKPPKPTGVLLEAFNDHADHIYSECEKTMPTPFTKFPACTDMPKRSWCAVSKIYVHAI
jgi:hypothetical protein